MENSKFTDLLKQYKAKMDEGITPLSDEDVAQVSGGVGGADEATCPYCTGSVAMNKINNPYGDPFWTCPKCGMDQYFSDDYFEFLGDTLSFRISIEPKDKTKADSASADTNAVQANKKFYNFKVLKETLKQDTTRILTTEGATIGLHYLHTSQWSETDCSLKIKGLLFIE